MTIEEIENQIVDEFSMVDMWLAEKFFERMKINARIVLVGDPDQLPSVGPGRLFDHLIRSGIVPVVRLTEIFRQAQKSDIVMNAHAVNEGHMPTPSAADGDFFFMKRGDAASVIETVAQLCSQRLPAHYGFSPSQIQVLSPARRQGSGTAALNRRLQEALNPPSENRREKRFGDLVFREGDRVMQTRNDYDVLWEREDGTAGAGIFNGDVGKILQIDPSGELISIAFDDRVAAYTADMLAELDMAYAMTVHKAQGSEYRAVVLLSAPAASSLMVRGVLYTALTRARELLILVGDDGIPGRMAANDRKARRYSGLRSGHGDRCRSRDLGAHRRLLSDLGSDRRDGGHPRLADRRLRHAGHVRGDLSRRHHADHRGGAASRQSDRVRTGAGHHRLYIGHRGHHRARPDRQFFRHAF